MLGIAYAPIRAAGPEALFFGRVPAWGAALRAAWAWWGLYKGGLGDPTRRASAYPRRLTFSLQVELSFNVKADWVSEENEIDKVNTEIRLNN